MVGKVGWVEGPTVELGLDEGLGGEDVEGVGMEDVEEDGDSDGDGEGDGDEVTATSGLTGIITVLISPEETGVLRSPNIIVMCVILRFI